MDLRGRDIADIILDFVEVFTLKVNQELVELGDDHFGVDQQSSSTIGMYTKVPSNSDLC